MGGMPRPRTVDIDRGFIHVVPAVVVIASGCFERFEHYRSGLCRGHGISDGAELDVGGVISGSISMGVVATFSQK